ncbi:hypothetical protein CPJCM30710_20350 [Clostridium polyendosporum]|uniref:EDD domain protein, DegV family n=1 Tax=Clostridium polyendosporum TaxID=69208 RepID=A0A919VEP0_9CLOT|nr:DegV family protein [Clostridium polyendosporum]GIM29369.1 hypothetical protein CPJCM30710_20350 [Clostridium polyendosporum]
MKDFIILTDSGCDLSLQMVKELNISYIGLVCNFEGKEYIEDCGQSLDYKIFYDAIRNGALPTTSQVNTFRFYEEFEKHVKEGKGVLYIAFSSALSGTYNSSLVARNDILENYPNADISIIDTKAASTGVGLLVYYAAKMKAEGKSKDEIVSWIEENKLNICHLLTVNDLNHLKRGGRISPTTAALGGLLNIKPVLYVNNEGQLKNFTKAKGSKGALRILFQKFEDHVINPENHVIFISHADNAKGAETLANMIREKYPVKDIIINYIGSVVGSHTGTGSIIFIFYGTNREP